MITYTITSEKQGNVSGQNFRKWWVHSNGQKICECWSRNQAIKIKKALEDY